MLFQGGKMASNNDQQENLPRGEILKEIIKGIRREVLLFGIAVIILLVGSARYEIQLFRELKWPILGFATLVLLLDVFTRALPRARRRVRDRLQRSKEG